MQRACAAACVLLFAQLRAGRLYLWSVTLLWRTGVGRRDPAAGRCCAPVQQVRAETPTGGSAVAKPARSRANACSRLYDAAICLCANRVAPVRGFSQDPGPARAD